MRKRPRLALNLGLFYAPWVIMFFGLSFMDEQPFFGTLLSLSAGVPSLSALIRGRDDITSCKKALLFGRVLQQRFLKFVS